MSYSLAISLSLNLLKDNVLKDLLEMEHHHHQDLTFLSRK